MYFILFFLSFTTLFSQNSYKITGELQSNSKNEVIVGAMISLLDANDSTIITGAYSKIENDKNIFELSAVKGNYILKISHISYKTKYIDLILNKNTNLGTIKLEQSEFQIEDVVVEGEKEFMELQLDKKVFNISQDATNKGRNASDILDNLPSVTVDAEGNVSLRGSENVRILVDGKQSGLVGRDPETLRMMMGDMIDKVEVITNPSARYDAEGQVGIINIVLKKEQKRGLNGSTEVNSGQPDNHGLSLSGNYRSDNYNLFTSIGIGYRKYPGFADVEQYFYNDPTKYLTTTRRDQRRGGWKNTFRVGSDFFVSDNHTLTVSGLYSFGNRNNFAELVYRDYNQSNDLLRATERTDNEAEGSYTYEFSVNYDIKFEGEGHELKFVSNFVEDEDLEESDLFQQMIFNSNGQNDLVQESSNLEFERNQLYQADYVLPFSKDGKFETGLKTTIRRIDNDFWLKEQNNSGEFEFVDEFNNNFLYLENIYAAYVMAGNKVSDFSYQFGLRSEYSDIQTELEKTNEKNPRTYFNFFPSAHFSYKLNQSNSLQLSYARRIQRPRFRMLMPISSFSDNRNFWIGNPNLDPEFADSYEMGYLLNIEKLSFLSSVYYRHSTNTIQRVTRVNEEGTTIMSPFNVGTRDDIGTEFNITYDPFKWLNLNTNFNLFNVNIEGNSNVGNLDAQSWTFNTKFTTKIKFPYGINLSTNYNYRGPMAIPQGRLKEIWFLDFALSKDIMENMTLTFTGSDVFSTRMRRMITREPEYYFDQDFQWRGGMFTFNLSYRLNQEKKQKEPFEGGDDE